MFVSNDQFRGDAVKIARLEVENGGAGFIVPKVYISFIDSKSGFLVAEATSIGSHTWEQSTKEKFQDFIDSLEGDIAKQFFRTSTQAPQPIVAGVVSPPSDGVESL